MGKTRLSRIRHAAVSMGVAVTMAAALMAAGVTTSQAADGDGVTSTDSVPLNSFVGLTPDRAYAIQANQGYMVAVTTLSAGPTFGHEWENLLEVQSNGAYSYFGFSASAARAIAEDTSGQTRLYDRGIWVGILPDDFSPDSLSGSWFRQRNTMTSLEGEHVDIAPYITTYSDNASSYIAGQLGSLFLVKDVTYIKALCGGNSPYSYCNQISSASLTVRDAANSGAVVGKAISPTPPAGAVIADLKSCFLSPGEVDCGWSKSEFSDIDRVWNLDKVWVTRSDFITGETTSVSLPVPSYADFGSYVDLDHALSIDYWEVADGVGVIQYYPGVIYAYDLNEPSRMVHFDGDLTAPVTDDMPGTIIDDPLVGNRLVMKDMGANHEPIYSDPTYRIVELPFGGGSAPHVIGVVGTKNTITKFAPLNLELDLTKPLNAGTLSIADPKGTVVATLKTPASTDGSLRGLTWTPPTGASGTYTWTLNATDSAGQMAVNNIGDGKASGTFMVKASPCRQFTDVAASNTFASAICWVSSTGITMGTGNGSTYSPSNPVNRGSMAAFLYRLAGSPKWDPPKSSPFADVKTTDTFYPAITWLYSQGITVGTTVNGKLYYQPGNAVNRGSMSAFLYRFSASPTWSVPTASPFTDVASSNTFYKSITWLADQKITVGSTANGKLVYQPGNPVNRGSMAAFMQRLAKTDLQCTRYSTAVGCRYILPPVLSQLPYVTTG